MARQRGARNKLTVEREQQALVAYQQAINRDGPVNDLVLLGKDILSRAANYFYALAVKHAEGAPGADPRLCANNMQNAAMIAAKLAPFESPRLSSVSVTRRLDLSRATAAELEYLNDLYARLGVPVEGGDTARAGETEH